MLKKINPSKTKAWKKLESHYGEMKSVHMKDLFAEDKGRSSRFSIIFFWITPRILLRIKPWTCCLLWQKKQI